MKCHNTDQNGKGIQGKRRWRKRERKEQFAVNVVVNGNQMAQRTQGGEILSLFSRGLMAGWQKPAWDNKTSLILMRAFSGLLTWSLAKRGLELDTLDFSFTNVEAEWVHACLLNGALTGHVSHSLCAHHARASTVRQQVGCVLWRSRSPWAWQRADTLTGEVQRWLEEDKIQQHFLIYGL